MTDHAGHDTVHFWTLENAEAVRAWNPDAEPDRYTTGYGHLILEMYHRFVSAGLPATIGERPSAGTRAVIVSLEELAGGYAGGYPARSGRLAAALLSGRRPFMRGASLPSLIVVRNDVPSRFLRPGATTCEVVGSQAAVARSDQVVLPVLRQRGLIPRDRARGAKVQTVALKAFSFNVPAWVDTVSADLAARGVKLRLDLETDAPGRWHDFRDVDAALCCQPARVGADVVHKPATKLVNAWAAGCLPLCLPTPSYDELIRPGIDAARVNDPIELAPLVAALNANTTCLEALLAGVAERADELAPDVVAHRWYDTAISAPLASRHALLADVAAAATVRLSRARQDQPSGRGPNG